LPTIRFDDRDPFAGRDDRGSLSCRLNRSEADVAGAPTVAQLVAALTA
jgi:hypothetical protein